MSLRRPFTAIFASLLPQQKPPTTLELPPPLSRCRHRANSCTVASKSNAVTAKRSKLHEPTPPSGQGPFPSKHPFHLASTSRMPTPIHASRPPFPSLLRPKLIDQGKPLSWARSRSQQGNNVQPRFQYRGPTYLCSVRSTASSLLGPLGALYFICNLATSVAFRATCTHTFLPGLPEPPGMQRGIAIPLRPAVFFGLDGRTWELAMPGLGDCPRSRYSYLYRWFAKRRDGSVSRWLTLRKAASVENRYC